MRILGTVDDEISEITVPPINVTDLSSPPPWADVEVATMVVVPLLLEWLGTPDLAWTSFSIPGVFWGDGLCEDGSIAESFPLPESPEDSSGTGTSALKPSSASTSAYYKQVFIISIQNIN